MSEVLTPEEFDRACRQLLAMCPGLSETSGYRSVDRNDEVDGNPASKHLLGMARDFVGTRDAMEQGLAIGIGLGLTGLVHDKGSGDHLHLQGLPVGDPPDWWVGKYGGF